MKRKRDEQTQDLRPTFEEVTEALAVVRGADDGNRWRSGDLAAAWLAQVVDGQKNIELGRLANASGYSYHSLRERHDCSVFWPKRNRRWKCAWSYYNRARRGVDLKGARERMSHLKEKPMNIDEFGNLCKVGNTNLEAPPPDLRSTLLQLDSFFDDAEQHPDASTTVRALLSEAHHFLNEAIAEAAPASEALAEAEAGQA